MVRCVARLPVQSYSKRGHEISKQRLRWPKRQGSHCIPTITSTRWGLMTGITTRSMPVMVVENRRFGNRAYCTLNEGLGKVMRFGGNDAEVLDRLAWLRDVLGPTLAEPSEPQRGIRTERHRCQGLVHGRRDASAQCRLQRPLAAPARALARAYIVRQYASRQHLCVHRRQRSVFPERSHGHGQGDHGSGTRHRRFLRSHRHVPQRHGFRHPGQRDRRPVVRSSRRNADKVCTSQDSARADANPDIGDSGIVETIGIGGFAMAASPAVVGFVGAGSPLRAVGLHAHHERDHRRPKSGMDARRRWSMLGCRQGSTSASCSHTGIAPVINTGIAHKRRRRGPGRRRDRPPTDRVLQAGAPRLRRSLTLNDPFRSRNEMRRTFYLDSVALMRLSRGIGDLEGIIDAALMIGSARTRH